MKMDTNLRIKTDKKHRTLYNQLTGFAVGESHELFFLCACLGYRRRKAKALGRSGDERFWSKTITPEEWCAYYAIILEEQNMNFAHIQDDKAVLSRIEEYANGGVEILIEECLADFLSSSSEVSIDKKGSGELPKILFDYLHDLGLSEETVA
jgi:hypothetical protein